MADTKDDEAIGRREALEALVGAGVGIGVGVGVGMTLASSGCGMGVSPEHPSTPKARITSRTPTQREQPIGATRSLGRTGVAVDLVSLGGQPEPLRRCVRCATGRARAIVSRQQDAPAQPRRLARVARRELAYPRDRPSRSLAAKREGRVRFAGSTGHADPRVLVEAMARYDFDTVLCPINPSDPHRSPTR